MLLGFLVVILRKPKNHVIMKSSAKPILIMVVLAVIVIAVIVLSKNKKGDGTSSTMKELVLIQYNDSPLSELSQEGIIEGFSQIGLNRNVDYKLKVNNAQGDITTLNLMVNDVMNSNPDLLFVTSTPTLQVATKKIKSIPVVFSVVADPVVAGAGTSFTNHASNITGISTMGDYEGMVEKLKLIQPVIKTVGTLFTPGEINSVKNKSQFEEFCTNAGMKLISVPVNSSTDVTDAMLSLIAKQPDIICQIIDNLTSATFSGIAKISKDHKIPLFGFVSDQAQKGAVLVVSRNYKQAGIDAVMLAKQIFDGQDPSEIPFRFVSKTDVYINLDAAEFYNVKLPDVILNDPNVIQVN